MSGESSSIRVGPDRTGTWVVVAEGVIAAAGRGGTPPPATSYVPCTDAAILPGWVNGHTHLYSALAPLGMPPPRVAPATFLEILERVWWRLDRALDPAALRAAARLYVAEALLSGTTSLVDHHESPSCIEGSLDVLAGACQELGIRALLGYGATERNGGRSEARRGLLECARFARANQRPLVRGLVALHASFTASDETLRDAGELCRELGVGMHVHLAEDACDVADAQRRGYEGPLERLLACGALPRGSIAAHGVHLSRTSALRAAAAGVWIVQNPRSNANNRVGYPVNLAGLDTVALGTDGFPADMPDELAALLPMAAAHGEDPEVAQRRAAASRAMVAQVFGVSLDIDTPGAAADLVVVAEHGVRDVMVAGAWVVRGGELLRADLADIRAEARAVAPKVWSAMEMLDRTIVASPCSASESDAGASIHGVGGGLGLEAHVVDPAVRARTVARFREAGVRLPTFAELIDPRRIAPSIASALAAVPPDAPDAHNLFRVHWYNGADRTSRVDVPQYLELPPSLTGVPARIVVALGRYFPMIEAHKVLAAYGCLVPRLVTGQFDPTSHRAIWPSTGNYCRGGVAISRILGCRGVAVLPAGMSAERFHWLARWVMEPTDVIRTPGTESNVKEIYDKCAELAQDEQNVIFNQFCEYGNHLVHYAATGRALEVMFESLQQTSNALRLRAFVSATGSAGTIAAGDYLKDRHGSLTVAVEALECPTLLYNGFGEHNIQGIGDKHVPLIHNVMATDVVTAISDRATDHLDTLFNSVAGRAYLIERRGIPAQLVERLSALGYSGICNVLAAIKTAKYYGMGPDDVVITVGTDAAAMYAAERSHIQARDFGGAFDSIHAAEVFGQHLAAVATDHFLELDARERDRVFNLGYFTWVEQQGVSLADFTMRRRQSFWRGLRDRIGQWDSMIEDFNRETGLA